MARADGRVTAGQRVGTAFSARAWNRAQDAADAYFNSQLSQSADPRSQWPSRLVVPVSVFSPFYGGVRVGHAVQLLTHSTGADSLPVWNTNIKDPPDDFLPTTTPISGEVVRARNFIQAGQVLTNVVRSADYATLGVIVGGSQMPEANGFATVQVCIAGPCIARIRVRGFVSEVGFVRPAFVRRPTDTAERLHGCLEVSDTGTARLVQAQFFGGQPYIAEYGTGNDFANKTAITWGLVVL